MKKTITILSMVLLGSLLACNNAEEKHTDAASDTAEAHQESMTSKDTSAKGMTGMDALISCQDAKIFTKNFVTQAVADGGGGHQFIINGSSPIAWEIPLADIDSLFKNNNNVIAMLAIHQGKLTLVLGGLENDGDSEPDIATNSNFQTFPPIRELNDYFPGGGGVDLSFIDAVLFKNCP